jgi:RecA-family ATPase
MNDASSVGDDELTHEDFSPVWDAVCATHPLLIEHITGPTRHDAIGLEHVIRAFHSHAVRLHRGEAFRHDLLLAMFESFPEGAFAHRVGSELFATDVGELCQRCIEELHEKNRRKAEPFFLPEDHALPVVRPALHRASHWAQRIIPPMRWIVEDWIPRQQVTGLYGVGGSLKTWLLMQGLMAKAAGLPFLGRVMEPGPTLGLFCEDTAEELARRMAIIATFFKRSLDDFRDFHSASLVGIENTELVIFDGQKMDKTDLLRWLDYYILTSGISFVALDTLAHMFGGEEVRRREVARFIRQLDAISIARDCALLFTAQPSVRGRNTGTMESGSTHWDAGVRSRLSWKDPTSTDGDAVADANPDLIRRVLTRQKSNYARPGETMELIRRNGGFIPAAVDAEAAKARERVPGRDAACEARFFGLLAKIDAQGDYVHNTANDPSHYAPAVFAKRPDGKPFSAPEYTRAMGRLFVAERLRIDPFGPPSRGKRRLVAAQP